MKCYFCAILNQMCKNRMEQEHQFIDYIEQSIIKNWDKDALTDYKGITLQYKDVARKIAKFHIVLESAGIQPGDKIAVCGRNSAHWGVTFLPLSLTEPSSFLFCMSSKRIIFIISSITPKPNYSLSAIRHGKI